MYKCKIANRYVGKGHQPFIIAEMSGNHNQSLDHALTIVEAAARAGVDAIKLQTYTADTMTINMKKEEFFINDANSLWQGQTLYELYKRAYTPWEWHETIFNKCRELGMVGFSSPFDVTAVDFLETLKVPAYKIASFENVDIPLIRKVAATGKPLFISTGMATVAVLDEAVQAAKGAGCNNIILLKCTSSYPASESDSNIVTIPHLAELFNCEVGLSDHTIGLGVPIASVALGATVIEKHFTMSRTDDGIDSPFSMEPDEMKMLVTEVRKAWRSIGKVSYGPTEGEVSSLLHRRSIYITEDLNAGEMITEKNIRIIRPGYGLEPKYYDILLGKRVKESVKKGTPVSWKML
ncbi:pseudaminic acid synthase [Cytobacillus sp. IB215665]|uniref:pseudaminic acid synthase n=1 Tax=Cytobacillus sp. IB215665 TaxID=3097357 RepID=UPI002A172544|nr:pseudaminic acid synthase [Cytobacillus sp. IB215665]MDX8364349.1 pseudaminic acid synthase [Cytobacillus sp. IB215665]